MPRPATSRRTIAAATAAIALACSSTGGDPTPADTAPPAPLPSPTPSPLPPATPTPPAGPPASPTPAAPGWTLAAVEDFEDLAPFQATWTRDPVPDDGPFADAGAFFAARGVTPPLAYRISLPFGDGAWLTLESYTRDASKPIAALAAIVPDPAGGSNHVLRVTSPAHTDATVLRPTTALPNRYRVSVRVGFASFGDGRAGSLNGYTGGETAEPWSSSSAVWQNGFYWLAVLDALPRPHNNVWIHHHRKVVVDTDNHHPPFMEIWDGARFVSSGEHPIMLFALDGRGPVSDLTGPPFLSWSAGEWQPSGAIRAVDAYLPDEWYDVTLERFDTVFTVQITGTFRYGGRRTYRATIDAAERCVFHYNRPGEDGSRCAGTDWPADGAWPDWFMFGDPHVNFYEGSVHYDEVRLEVWR